MCCAYLSAYLVKKSAWVLYIRKHCNTKSIRFRNAYIKDRFLFLRVKCCRIVRLRFVIVRVSWNFSKLVIVRISCVIVRVPCEIVCVSGSCVSFVNNNGVTTGHMKWSGHYKQLHVHNLALKVLSNISHI